MWQHHYHKTHLWTVWISNSIVYTDLPKRGEYPNRTMNHEMWVFPPNPYPTSISTSIYNYPCLFSKKYPWIHESSIYTLVLYIHPDDWWWSIHYLVQPLGIISYYKIPYASIYSTMFFFQHYIKYVIDSILNSIILKPPSFSPRRAGAALIRGFHGHRGVREGGQAGARGAGWDFWWWLEEWEELQWLEWIMEDYPWIHQIYQWNYGRLSMNSSNLSVCVS